jgi:hypothetical protein
MKEACAAERLSGKEISKSTPRAPGTLSAKMEDYDILAIA